MNAKRLMAVEREIATVCGGKHPPMDLVYGWLSVFDNDKTLRVWVTDNATTTGYADTLIDEAIKRADGGSNE